MDTKYCQFMDDGATVRDVLVIPSGFDIAGVLSPEAAALYAPCPEQVEANWYYDREKDQWLSPEEAPGSAPEPVSPSPVRPVVSPVEFKLLFTAMERIAIARARAEDPVIDDFYSIVDDPRLTQVALSWKSTQDGVDYIISKGLVAPERREAILTGQFQ